MPTAAISGRSREELIGSGFMPNIHRGRSCERRDYSPLAHRRQPGHDLGKSRLYAGWFGALASMARPRHHRRAWADRRISVGRATTSPNSRKWRSSGSPSRSNTKRCRFSPISSPPLRTISARRSRSSTPAPICSTASPKPSQRDRHFARFRSKLPHRAAGRWAAHHVAPGSRRRFPFQVGRSQQHDPADRSAQARADRPEDDQPHPRPRPARAADRSRRRLALIAPSSSCSKTPSTTRPTAARSPSAPHAAVRARRSSK